MQLKNIPRGLGLFGTADDIAVQRGIAEFQAGRPVIIADADELIVALPVDGLTEIEPYGLLMETPALGPTLKRYSLWVSAASVPASIAPITTSSIVRPLIRLPEMPL